MLLQLLVHKTLSLASLTGKLYFIRIKTINICSNGSFFLSNKNFIKFKRIKFIKTLKFIKNKKITVINKTKHILNYASKYKTKIYFKCY